MENNQNENNLGNITQNISNPDLTDSLPPAKQEVSQPIVPPITSPINTSTPVSTDEKYAFPDHTEKDLAKKLRKEKAKEILKHVPLILFILVAIALGYLYINTRNALASQKSATDKANSDYTAQKAIVDAKSNCDVCPAVPVEAAPTSTTTTTKRSTSSAQESVVAPPAPPAD